MALKRQGQCFPEHSRQGHELTRESDDMQKLRILDDSGLMKTIFTARIILEKISYLRQISENSVSDIVGVLHLTLTCSTIKVCVACREPRAVSYFINEEFVSFPSRSRLASIINSCASYRRPKIFLGNCISRQVLRRHFL